MLFMKCMSGMVIRNLLYVGKLAIVIPVSSSLSKDGLPAPSERVFFVRPAWAHSCGCKSRRELTTANEAKCNCGRVTDRGEEAWSESASRCTRIGYKALPSRASGQETAKLLWSRRSGVNPAVVQ